MNPKYTDVCAVKQLNYMESMKSVGRVPASYLSQSEFPEVFFYISLTKEVLIISQCVLLIHSSHIIQ